jgi:proline iminopeptidase
VLAVACGGAGAKPDADAPSDVPPASAACGPERLREGGHLLRLSDGVELWYAVAGRPDAPAMVFLHGGPGYNSFVFERSAGKLLEASWRMIYVDQRGAGRSGFEGSDASYGMAQTVQDFEELRVALGVRRWTLLGHSFGGLVAAEYARRYTNRVERVVLVDISPELGTVFEHHLQVVDRVADSSFPEHAREVHAIVGDSSTSAFDRMQRLYALVGRVPIQLHLHYPSRAAQQEMDALDEASGLSECTSARVPAAFAREGYLDDRPAEPPLPVPTLLIGGGASQIVGTENLGRAARLWGAELALVEGAGHFVYFDRPHEFSELVTRFGSNASPAAP